MSAFNMKNIWCSLISYCDRKVGWAVAVVMISLCFLPASAQSYPSFTLSEKTTYIDARIYPQGYIYADSMAGIHNTTESQDTSGWGEEESLLALQLLNLPITSTVKLHIHHVDMEMSGFDNFRIFHVRQSANQENFMPLRVDIFSTHQSVRDVYKTFSGNSTLSFQYRKNSRNTQRSSVHLSYTVASCDEDIPMLKSLRQIHDNISDYEVTCEDDFRQFKMVRTILQCTDNQWSSKIICVGQQTGKNTATQATDIESDQFSDLDTDFGYESIVTTDPYLDYSTINQNDTLSVYQRNILHENPNPSTEDCNHRDIRKQNSEPPQLSLYETIVKEMRSKGIELQNTPQPERVQHQDNSTSADHFYENWSKSKPVNSVTDSEEKSSRLCNSQSTYSKQGQKVNPEAWCYDDDAESVYEMYTITDNVKSVFKAEL